MAEQLLPTQSGFFFGSTEYDEGYFEDCKRTVEIVQKALAAMNAGEAVFYESSW